MYESVANAKTQGLLFCFCAPALCTCLGKNVHPHSLVSHFRNPRLSRNCNYPYVDRRSVVDIYYVSSGFHMFSHQEYLGHGRSRNMWRPMGTRHHYPTTVDSDRFHHSYRSSTECLETTNADSSENGLNRATPHRVPVSVSSLAGN